LHFRETLRGSYFCVDAQDDVRVCEVVLDIRMPRSRMDRKRAHATMEGAATFDGLAEAAPLAGSLTLDLVRPRRVSYEFAFQSRDGRTLRFQGAKHPSLLRPLFSATTLWGTVFEADKAVAMARLHFDLRRDLVAFLQSLARAAGEG
jgi:hypothetical protein